MPLQIEEYLDRVRLKDNIKYLKYRKTYLFLMDGSQKKINAQYYECIVKAEEPHVINQKGEASGRPRNICNPSDEWKVLGGFV